MKCTVRCSALGVLLGGLLTASCHDNSPRVNPRSDSVSERTIGGEPYRRSDSIALIGPTHTSLLDSVRATLQGHWRAYCSGESGSEYCASMIITGDTIRDYSELDSQQYADTSATRYYVAREAILSWGYNDTDTARAADRGAAALLIYESSTSYQYILRIARDTVVIQTGGIKVNNETWVRVSQSSKQE